MRHFKELLSMADYQPEPVKLLMLFVKVSGQSEGQGMSKGILEPLMCVDKLPGDMSSFDELCRQADEINPDWAFVFVTSINAAADDTLVEKSMKAMIDDVQSGKNTASYVVFDRQENVVEMQSA